MPRELTGAEESAWNRYQAFGTPDEIETQIKRLRRENATHRTKRSELEAEVETLRGQVPGEGAQTISKADADALAAYRELGKLEEVKAALGERDTLKSDLARRERQDTISAAVKAEGWPEDTIPTLTKLLDGATVELRTEKVRNDAGKEEERQVPYVTLPGDGQKAQRLSELPTTTAEFKGLKTSAAGNQTQDRRWAEQRTGEPPRERTADDVRKATEQTANYTL